MLGMRSVSLPYKIKSFALSSTAEQARSPARHSTLTVSYLFIHISNLYILYAISCQGRCHYIKISVCVGYVITDSIDI